jgi:chromosome segregation ATPase
MNVISLSTTLNQTIEKFLQRKSGRITLSIVLLFFVSSTIGLLILMKSSPGTKDKTSQFLQLDEEETFSQSILDKKFQVWEKKMYIHTSAIKGMRDELADNKKRHEADLRRLDSVENALKQSARENYLNDVSNKLESQLNSVRSEVNALRMEVNNRHSDDTVDRLTQQIDKSNKKEGEFEKTVGELRDIIIQLQQQIGEVHNRLDQDEQQQQQQQQEPKKPITVPKIVTQAPPPIAQENPNLIIEDPLEDIKHAAEKELDEEKTLLPQDIQENHTPTKKELLERLRLKLNMNHHHQKPHT